MKQNFIKHHMKISQIKWEAPNYRTYLGALIRATPNPEPPSLPSLVKCKMKWILLFL
jgi:hypothetical protein